MSALPEEYAMPKVAVIAFSYMVAEDCYDHVGNICYANGVKKEKIATLTENTSFLDEMNDFLLHHSNG